MTVGAYVGLSSESKIYQPWFNIMFSDVNLLINYNTQRNN